MVLSGCEKDWLDINQSPNTATTVEPQYLFGYAITSWSGNRTGGDSYWAIGFMTQLIATGGDFGWGYSEDRYDFSPYTLGNTWKLYYATGGGNLKKAIELAEEKEMPNIAAQCKIAFACMFYECTMIWGDVPYSEAWTDENYPNFDEQKNILNGLITLLDEAIAQIDKSSPYVITTEDLYYNGDLDKWKILANSMKLKIALTMVDADDSKSSLIGNLISEDLITSAANDFKFPFVNEAGNENPQFKLFKKHGGGKNTWMMANSIMLDSMMIPLHDPRIEKYFEPGEDAIDVYKGVYTATEADNMTSLMRIGDGTTIAADSPDVIVSSSEINFLLAEIYVRGIGTTANLPTANQYFKNALTQSLEFNGVAASDIETFVNKTELDLTSVSNPLKVLYEQQWIDFYNRALEAWILQRRSGPEGNEVPNLQTPKGAPVPAGEIARRWDYPDVEITGNINVPSDLPHIWDNLWFDK